MEDSFYAGSSSVRNPHTSKLPLIACPLCCTGTQLELRTSRTPANPNKRFVKCPRIEHTEWACKFFMWETQYEQLLKDMQAGNRQAGRLVLNHDGGKPWMGPVVPDFRVGERVLVYLGVLQALLLLLILVVVISK
ncbi:Os07g0190500 [Oryza sativa Japonica Group]|uniref:Os07g0190500 protein n=1 Tax=Oryza sativa subsp. japonica TaxID=39947 RepID=A0A0P0X3C1_ORYSJ|nr:Os07g0190500 [Oryza sativa Japonica Group]